VAHGRHVHPDLVGPAGLEGDLDQAGAAEGLDRVVVGDAVSASRDHREPAVAGGVPGYRRVHRAPQRIGVTLHQRVVALVHRALPESPLQRGVGPLALGEDHQPRGVRVQPVDDSLPLGGTAGRDGVTCGEQPFQHGRPAPAGRGMRRHPGWLVHHDDVGVLVDDGQPRHCLRYRRQGGGWRWQGNVEPLSRRHPVRLGGGVAGHQHPPAGDQLRRRRPGKPEHARERRVEALTVQPFRDGYPALVPRGHARCFPAAVLRGHAALPCGHALPSPAGLPRF
jgi:hypothetical protein